MPSDTQEVDRSFCYMAKTKKWNQETENPVENGPSPASLTRGEEGEERGEARALPFLPSFELKTPRRSQTSSSQDIHQSELWCKSLSSYDTSPSYSDRTLPSLSSSPASSIFSSDHCHPASPEFIKRTIPLPMTPQSNDIKSQQQRSIIPSTPPRSRTNYEVDERSLLKTPSGFEFIDFGEQPNRMARARRSFEWEVFGPDSPHSLNLTHASKQVFKRRLGPTEVSYYLGSRGEGVESGVNDMYLHIGFKAKSELMKEERLLSVWTEITLRHHLLASKVEYSNFDDIRFVYERPNSAAAARAHAKSLMEIRIGQDPKALLDDYLNRDRTLSDERLSYLVFSTPESSMNAQEEQEYDMYLFSTHFLGDGMALHTTANEIFSLLAGSAPPTAPSETAAPLLSKNIEAVLEDQKNNPIFHETETEEDEDEGAMGPAFLVEKLAQAMESKLITPEGWGRMAWAGARVEYNQNQSRLIGGQAFPRAKRGERKTLVPTISYDSQQTKQILASCKAHGTTIAHAVFALTNLAYIRSTPDRDERLPMMIYSALNMRGNLKKEQDDWYHIAIGYYNIILSSFLPKSISPEQAFWHRASIVRKQTSAIVKSKWLGSRSKLMALERERRSIGFEREDERKRQEELQVKSSSLLQGLQGLGISFEPKLKALEAPSPSAPQTSSLAPAAPITSEQKSSKAPSVALMGLSMLGNLDGMYAHKSYHGLQLHTLTTGSRQRPGAILLFAYTFAGKFWLSLGYDTNGFKEDVINSWWLEMQKGVDEMFLGKKSD